MTTSDETLLGAFQKSFELLYNLDETTNRNSLGGGHFHHLPLNDTSKDDSIQMIFKKRLPLESIDAIPSKATEIYFYELNQLCHLVYGSNSSICSANLKGIGPVIVKIMKTTVKNRQSVVEEFEEEHKILCRLNHTHIMDCYGKGILQTFGISRTFIVLERMDSGTLSDLLYHNGYFHNSPLSVRQILDIAISFADALDYLHEKFNPTRTLIHRDLKPDNIGFTRDGTLKLIDFGLTTCVLKGSHHHITYKLTGNTGSLRYMAREVYLSNPYNEKVDIYSYGIILWEAATSTPPFGEWSSQEDFVNHVIHCSERPPLDPLYNKPGLPKEFSELLSACWHADYTQRPSASDILIQTRQMLHDIDSAYPKHNPLGCVIS